MGIAYLLLALVLSGAGSTHPPVPRGISRRVTSIREAKMIAERNTGGIATGARPIPLNGATGGWEVDIHMPDEDQGWRCIVDCDTHMVHMKTHIPNPKLGKNKR